MILSTHEACLTQSPAAPSPIKMASLLRMRGRQPGRVTVSCGHLEGGWCRGLDQDLRTPQHICSQISLCLPPGIPSHPRGLFSPSASPTHRASVTPSPHLWPLTQHLRCLRGSPQDPAFSLYSAGHLSPAHTQGSVIKS